jgi:PAS domain-containing protein
VGRWKRLKPPRQGIEENRGAVNDALTLEVAERQRAEEELTESRRRLQAALDAARLGVWARDLVTGEFACDQRAKTIIGIEPEATVTYGQSLSLLVAEDREALSRLCAGCCEEQDSNINAEYRIQPPDGHIRLDSSPVKGTICGQRASPKRRSCVCGGGYTPYRFHSRNHGLAARVSSCFWFAAFQSAIWSLLGSGSESICSSNSISAMVFSRSMSWGYRCRAGRIGFLHSRQGYHRAF